MSTSKGSTSRSRPQKYQNRTVFKNTLYDKSDNQKKINNLQVCAVCQHCKDIIEWKIKYKKYKPLKQPKTCIKCSQKTVKKAYHVMCRECALAARVCAKCLKSSEEVQILPPEPTEIEQQKLKAEMDKLIKSLPERKRRSFLRYMKKGKQVEESGKNDEENNEHVNGDGEDPEEKEIKRVPHTREALLKKIEELKINECDDNDDDDDDDDSNFSDDEYDYDEYDDEGDNSEEFSESDNSDEKKEKKISELHEIK